MARLLSRAIMSRTVLPLTLLLTGIYADSHGVRGQTSGGVFDIRAGGCDIPPDPKDVAAVVEARAILENMEISGVSEKELIKQMDRIRLLEYKTGITKQHVIKDRHGTSYTTKLVPHPVETEKMATVLKRLFPRIQTYLLQRKNGGDQYVWENIINVASNYEQHGLKQQALELLDLISDKDENVPAEKRFHAYRFKFRIYEGLGDTENSKVYCKETIKAGEIYAKSNPWTLEEIAGMYEKLGDNTNAASTFEKLFADTKYPYLILHTPNYYDVLVDLGRKDEAARLRAAYRVRILAGPSMRWPGNKENALKLIEDNPSIVEILPSYTLARLGLTSLAEKRRAEEQKKQ